MGTGPAGRLLHDGFSPYGVAYSSIFLDGSRRDGLLWERMLGDWDCGGR
ncbi:hypothetical protein ACFQ6Q_21435 [Streptomyces sp. NPDC056437]